MNRKKSTGSARCAFLTNTVLTALALASCGGGGGGKTQTTSSSPPPAQNASPSLAAPNADQVAYTAVDFSYDASQGGTTFSDSDGDSLTYSVNLTPSGNGLTANQSIISGQLTQASDVTVTISASDPSGATATDTFVISGEESVAATSQCPAANDPSTAINTAVSLILDAAVDAATVNADSVQVACPSSTVSGTATLDPNGLKLVFTPDTELPGNAVCSATTDASLRGADGRPVRQTAWQFTTGTTTADAWVTGIPTDVLTIAKDVGSFSLPQFRMHHSAYIDDQHLILFSFNGNLRTAVSTDDGQTYTVSDPILDPIWETLNKWSFDFTYGGGRFHIVFRTQGLSQVTGLETIELIYLYSTASLLEFSVPAIVTDENDFYSIFSPGVAADDTRVVFTWEQRSCFGCPINLPDQGVYLAEFHLNGGPPIWTGRLQEDAKMSAIEITGGDVIVKWQKDTSTTVGFPQLQTQFYNYTDSILMAATGVPLNAFSIVGLESADQTHAMFTWITTDTAQQEQYLNYALYDASTDQLEYFYQDKTFQGTSSLNCEATFATNYTDSSARAVFMGTRTAGEIGTIDFSSDGARTFGPALDVAVYDNNWCPKIAVKDNATLFAATVDSGAQTDPDSVTIQSLRTGRGRPCE